VVADEGLDALVLQIDVQGVTISHQGQRVELVVGAGASWQELVAKAVAAEYQGLECLAGIPGRVGATPIQNVGAYGQEVSETIFEVGAVSLRTRKRRNFTAEECQFQYRDSFFKTQEPDSWVVVSVGYCLRRGASPDVRYAELSKRLAAREIERPSLSQVHDAVIALRRDKSMVLPALDDNRRSCGSFFVNPVVPTASLTRIQEVTQSQVPNYPVDAQRTKIPAAWLIEKAGLSKGMRERNVGLSSKHALALVCHEGATARELIAIAQQIRRRVWERFAVKLVPEPNFWGFSLVEDRLPI
jgi:UDP-N-acetylmuramate dehydrogenase